MMANNWQRLNIWLKLNNRFDYGEYAIACRTEGAEPQSQLEFAQKAGMVAAGLATYPELPVAEAYLQYIQDNQQAFTPPSQPQQPAQQSAGSLPPGYKLEKVTITFSDGRAEEKEIVVPDGTQKQGCCGGGAVK